MNTPTFSLILCHAHPALSLTPTAAWAPSLVVELDLNLPNFDLQSARLARFTQISRPLFWQKRPLVVPYRPGWLEVALKNIFLEWTFI